MKPCKYAYKLVRDSSSEIFKGFGFKHLSDATHIMFTLTISHTRERLLSVSPSVKR